MSSHRVGSSALRVFRCCPSQTSSGGSQRYALSTEATGWSSSSSAQLTKQKGDGLGTKCLQSETTPCVFSPPCGSDKGEKKAFEGCFHSREIRESGGVFQKVRRAPRLRATQTHTGMAEVEDTVRAAGPSWYGGLEREVIYRRTNYIHEMSCGEVGSHLYRRMCCAGRSERSATVHLCNGRRFWLGGAAAGDDVDLLHASTQRRNP